MYVSSTCEFHDIRFYDIPRYQGMHEDAAGSTDSEVEVEEEQEDRGTSRRGTSASRGLPKRCAKMRSASCASSSPCGMMAQCAVYRAVQSNRRLIRSRGICVICAQCKVRILLTPDPYLLLRPEVAIFDRSKYAHWRDGAAQEEQPI